MREQGRARRAQGRQDVSQMTRLVLGAGIGGAWKEEGQELLSSSSGLGSEPLAGELQGELSRSPQAESESLGAREGRQQLATDSEGTFLTVGELSRTETKCSEAV